MRPPVDQLAALPWWARGPVVVAAMGLGLALWVADWRPK